MKPEFYRGFTVYRNLKPQWGLVLVVLHSGPSLETPTSRDMAADTVAGICAKNLNGNLVLSNTSRKRIYGIDFNRQNPPKNMALKYYHLFMDDVKMEALHDYRKKYAWVARDAGDHEERSRIYNRMWSLVRHLGSFYIMMHSKYCRIKNYPSVMDINTFAGKGVDPKIIKEVVNDINKEYKAFFRKIEPLYKDSAILEEQRAVNRIERIFSSFNLKKMKIEYKENILNGINFIERYGGVRLSKKLKAKMSKESYISAAKKAIKKSPLPCVTIERIFKGETSYGPRNQIKLGKGKILIQIEVNEFFSRFYPDDAADIIVTLIRKLRNVERYKSMGLTQTEILKFTKN